ncbi:DUF1015 family protein [uncultured Jatrophihabitans sp.]|uniref:DUF1015 family protein n=1 Tax=uncultured Jatrophihabitans sp. TaxID=1610747 RepID=UPI0035CAC3A5
MNPDGSVNAAGLSQGLSLAPFRASRPHGSPEHIASLLCPPYDVIDAAQKAELLRANPDNAVGVILPDPTPEGYRRAAQDLTRRVHDGLYAVDDAPALYVYEMSDGDQHTTRGLVGAVELRDPADGVVLPHENTMAGPVADRLELMTATDSDLEPIYLVYDGGGPASGVTRGVDSAEPLAQATTPDGITHRLWAVTDRDAHAAVSDDLAGRRALIADGHHRYATYRERQRRRRGIDGPGPWDRGLALLVDSTDYGPQVHAIHRVIPGLSFADAVERLGGLGHAEMLDTARSSENPAPPPEADGMRGFAVVVTDGGQTALLTDPDGTLRRAAQRPGDVPALSGLDVTVLHRGLIERAWGVVDDVDTVKYAHSVDEAIRDARDSGGIAVLLRATPVAAVTAVAAAGARMPRKSTLFTPKPASGLLIRRLIDQDG